MRNLSLYIDDRFPETSSVQNLESLIKGVNPVTGQNVIPTITACVRLWHQDTVTPLNLANPRLEHDANNISEFVRGATVSHTLSGDVHRTFELSFSDLLATQIQTLTCLAQPFIQYRDANTIDNDTGEFQVLVEFSQGLFMFELATRSILMSGDVYKAVGSDLTQLVCDVGFESPYVLPIGVNLVDAWIAALAADKLSPGDAFVGLHPRIPSGTYPYWNFPGTTPCGCCDNPGPNFPTSRLHITPNAMTAAATMPFYREQNQYALSKALAAQLGYEDLWALDADLYARPLPYSTSTPVVPEFSCDTGDNSMVKSIEQRPVDRSVLRNLVTAISANSSLPEPIVKVKKNFSTQSNISITNLGYIKSGAPVQDDRLLTDEQVDALAFITANEDALADEAVEVEMGLPIPHLTNNDAWGLNAKNKDGQYEIDSRYYPFLITAHTTDLMTMSQKITAGKLVAV